MGKGYSLSLYFGIPGAGKTTFAAYLARQDLKHNRKVFSNVPITGTIRVEKEDVGRSMMVDGRLIWDEAGIDYDNRKMDMSKDEIYFYKYHRHYQMNVDFFSQGLDVDIKIRKLARHIYLVRNSILPFFIERKEIGRRVGIDDISHQIVDEYFFKPGFKLIYCPPLWKLFNTYSRRQLPEKSWTNW